MISQEQAVQLVRDYLAVHGMLGWTYEVMSVREHPTVWAVAFQPYVKGQPAYDFVGFDVNKASGAVLESGPF